MTDPALLTPRIVAAAKATLCDTRLMGSVTPSQRADLVTVAFGILRDARAARLAQASRPRIVVTPRSPTPGDAA